MDDQNKFNCDWGLTQSRLPPYTFEFKEFADSSTKLIVRRGPKEKKKKT